jgi:hypothetical protein
MAEIFVIDSFWGLNTEDDPILLPPGYAEALRDVDYRSVRGVLQGERRHSLLYPLTNPRGLFGWKDGVFYTSLTSLYYNGVELLDDWGDRFTACEFMSFANSPSRRSTRTLAMTNGSRVLVTDGEDVWSMGVTAPNTTFMTATKVAGSAFTAGHWFYRVTFVNEDGFEGNASSAEVEVLGGLCASVALANIPVGSTDEAITRKRIYRTQNGSSSVGPYFLLDEIDNDDTAYSDTTLDVGLYPNSPPIDHDPPTQTCFIIWRSGLRWFLSGDTTHPLRVYYSKPAPYAEAWPLEYYIDLPDAVKAGCPLGNYSLVLTETTPFMIQIDQEGNASYQELPSRMSASSSWAVLQWDNEAFWRGPLGLYRTNGITVQEDSESVRGLFPQDSEISTLTVDSQGRLLLTFNNYFASANNGIIVAINDMSEEDTYSWVDSLGAPTEVGTIKRMVGSNTYVFSSEYGRVTYIDGGGVGRVSSTLIRERRSNGLIWSSSSQDTIGISSDLEKKTTYAAIPSGICNAFVGGRLAWQWKSVSSYLGQAGRRKRLNQVTLYLKGRMDISIYGDGELIRTLEWPKDFYDFDQSRAGFIDSSKSEWNDSTLSFWQEYHGSTGLTVLKIQSAWDTWAYTYQIGISGAAESQLHLPIIFQYELEKLL